MIGRPPGYELYRGCGNCKHQPEPLAMCEWGKHRSYVELFCSGWELREEGAKDGETDRHTGGVDCA